MRRQIVAGLFMLLGATTALGQQNSAIRNATGTVTVTTGISITRNADLRFGSIVRPVAAGTVVVTPLSARTSATLLFGNGAFGAANFTVFRGGNGNPHYDIVLPTSITIGNGLGQNMTVDTFTSNPTVAAGGFAQPSETLTVGATLHVGANQAFGSYTGFFAVTVIKN